MKGPRTVCHTPTPDRKPTRIDTWKYVCVRRAILAAVPDDEAGIEARLIPDRVREALAPDDLARLGSVGWFTTSVRLDLEVRGELVRLERPGAVRVRRGPGHNVLTPVRKRDAAALTEMVAAFHAFEGIELDPEARRRSVQTLMSDKALGLAWFIHAGPERVGYLAACFGYSLEFGGQDAFVDEIWLEEGYRGQGLGRRALEALAAAMARRSVRAVHLEVGHDNVAAAALYEQLGFQGRDGYRLMTRVL